MGSAVGRWILLIGCLAISARPAEACQCGRVPTALEGLGQADAVFEGVVTNLWPVALTYGPIESLGNTYTFRITALWKGALESEVTLRDSGGNCSYRFRWGQSYTVFASLDPEHPTSLTATICTPTSEGLSLAEWRSLGPYRVVSNDYLVEPESLAHTAARRTKLGLVYVLSGLRSWFAALNDSARGVIVKYALGLLSLLVLAAYLVLAWRKAWRRLFFLAVAAPLMALLLVAAWGYSQVAQSPFSYIAY